jgi:hypothetical protein
MNALLNPEGAPKPVEPAQELTDKAKIYAARMRFQTTGDQADALEAIREVIANLIGSEEVALYRVDDTKAVLWLYWSFGIDPNQHFCFDLMHEPNMKPAIEGEVIFRDPNSSERLLTIATPVSALVPIRKHGAVVALLIIFRLLPQKSKLDAADREICEMLSNWGGRAVANY